MKHIAATVQMLRLVMEWVLSCFFFQVNHC